MKTKFNPAIVGLFVIGGIVAFIFALLSFGGIHLFSKPQRFVVYFDETIHGLDLGSPVKLRGVRVGRVVNINVNYNSEKKESVVAVVCELSRNVIADEKGQPVDVSDATNLQKFVDNGLRAQLGVLGLATGLLYVEMDFYDINQYPPDTLHIAPNTKHTRVPAVRSAISEFQASLTEILSNVKRIDFPSLAKELQGLLADTRKQINGLNLAQLNAEWANAGRTFGELAKSPEIPAMFAKVNATLDQLSAALVKLDTKIDPAGDELTATLAQAKETLKSFNTTALAARNFISAQNGLGDEATRAMGQLADAASAIQRLADFLERNPTALISGKKQP